MGTGTFEAGREIVINAKPYQMLRMVTDDIWQIEDTRTRRIIECSVKELQKCYVEGSLQFMVSERSASTVEKKHFGSAHEEYSKADWDLAKVRRSYVMAIINFPATKEAVRQAIEAHWQVLKKPIVKPSPTSVLRWKRRFTTAECDIRALMDNKAKRGNRSCRYPDAVSEFTDIAIETVYLTLERKTVQDTIHKAQALVLAENKLRPKSLALPLPKRRYVENKISEIPAFDRYAARYGRTAAVAKFRAVLGNRITEAPLERVEIDHTKLDLFIIDDKTGLPLGRPWLTICIDDYTRCILGIYLGFEPPSYLTVARCLRDAFLPKVNLKVDYPDIVHEWEAHGVMRVLVVDNGPEFHSESLENACLTLPVEIDYAPRKTPWFKGKIERVCKTSNEGISQGVPGTTFSNIFEKGDYDPAEHAVVRLSKARHIIRKWIADVYHQRPHRTLHAPPAEVWKANIVQEDIRVPCDPAELDAILGRCESRTLTHKGIELDCLFYNSRELANLRQRLGDTLKVEIRVDDSDLGHIIVLSPDKNRRFKVPALAFGYARGLTRWQHAVCRRFAAERLALYDSAGWIEAKEAIAELIQGEVLRMKPRSHARVARFIENKDSQNPAVLDSSSQVSGNYIGITQHVCSSDNESYEEVTDSSEEDNLNKDNFNLETESFPIFPPLYRHTDDLESGPEKMEDN